MAHELNRRDVLKLATAASVLGLAGPVFGQAGGRLKKIRMGFIGVGARGTGMLKTAMLNPGLEIPAVCDIVKNRITTVNGVLAKAGWAKPEAYGKNPTDYRRMLEREDLDAVFIATPMQLHAGMAVDALNAGKHVCLEVPAATTLEDCWRLVRAAERSGKTFMLAENCCYYMQNLMVRAMAEKGLFGEYTYAECGYVHEIRSLLFKGNGDLTWRGELCRDLGDANWYPTHSLGPVAQWLGIHRGDRLVSLTSQSSNDAGIRDYAAKRFGKRWADTRFGGDSNHALIKTAKGVLIDLRFDIVSAHPHSGSTYFTLQGTRGSYVDHRRRDIWLQDKSAKLAWERLDKYRNEFHPQVWKEHGELAKKTAHGGADFFIFSEFLDTLRRNRPSPVDVYDAAAWSCMVPLTQASAAKGGAPQKIPDFTKGKWKTRT